VETIKGGEIKMKKTIMFFIMIFGYAFLSSTSVFADNTSAPDPIVKEVLIKTMPLFSNVYPTESIAEEIAARYRLWFDSMTPPPYYQFVLSSWESPLHLYETPDLEQLEVLVDMEYYEKNQWDKKVHTIRLFDMPDHRLCNKDLLPNYEDAIKMSEQVYDNWDEKTIGAKLISASPFYKTTKCRRGSTVGVDVDISNWDILIQYVSDSELTSSVTCSHDLGGNIPQGDVRLIDYRVTKLSPSNSSAEKDTFLCILASITPVVYVEGI
jgi:hypothetical protein